jgi:hypothetical protein
MNIEEPYKALRRRWTRARQILRSLTPEAGETYNFYKKMVEDMEAKFVKKVDLWPDSRSKIKKRAKQLPAPVEKPPIDFRISW